MVANNLGIGSRAAHNWVRAVIAENQVRGAKRGERAARDQQAPDGMANGDSRRQHTAGHL